MKHSTFFIYNVVGGFLWSVGLSLLGYFLGKSIPDIDRYLLPIIGLIIFISVLPTLIHVVKDRETRKKIISSVKNRRKKRIDN
jgi:membrane-associated protein